MKKLFTVDDLSVVKDILDSVEFGTLALCKDNKPYSLPLNFVESEGEIYFHGAKRGRGKKMEILRNNPNVAFSVVESLSLLPSYFSNDKKEACEATHLFKSVHMEGVIKIVEEYEQKAKALQALMEKYQKEESFAPLSDEMYQRAINATTVFKLTPSEITCKVKLGQNFSEERLQKVVKNLKERGTPKDLKTLELLKSCVSFH